MRVPGNTFDRSAVSSRFGRKNKARESLTKAKELIDKMGMHQWDFEARELAEKLS